MVRSQDKLTFVASENGFADQRRSDCQRDYKRAAGFIPADCRHPSLRYSLSAASHYSLKRIATPPPTKKTFLYVHRYIRLLQWPRWSRRSKVTPVTNVERQLCRTVYRIGHIASGLAGGGNSHRSATPCGTGETRSRNWKHNNDVVLSFSTTNLRLPCLAEGLLFVSRSLDFYFRTYILSFIGRFWVNVIRFIIQSQEFSLLKGLICGRYPQVFAFRKVKCFPP